MPHNDVLIPFVLKMNEAILPPVKSNIDWDTTCTQRESRVFTKYMYIYFYKKTLPVHVK